MVEALNHVCIEQRNKYKKVQCVKFSGRTMCKNFKPSNFRYSSLKMCFRELRFRKRGRECSQLVGDAEAGNRKPHSALGVVLASRGLIQRSERQIAGKQTWHMLMGRSSSNMFHISFLCYPVFHISVWCWHQETLFKLSSLSEKYLQMIKCYQVF